jgi:F-type H+-transporting ATPase subunit epsilon
MNNAGFMLEIITPRRITSRKVISMRLKDRSGFFGIMKGHADFLAVLSPALCYYTADDGREHFLAMESGIFSMRGGTATLTSRELFECDDAGQLAELIDDTMARRDESEQALSRMISGIEHSFLEKTAAFARGRR